MFLLETKINQQVERKSVRRIQESEQPLESQGAKCSSASESIYASFQLTVDLPNLFKALDPFESLIFPYFYGRTVNVPPPPYNSSHENEAIDSDKKRGQFKTDEIRNTFGNRCFCLDPTQLLGSALLLPFSTSVEALRKSKFKIQNSKITKNALFQSISKHFKE